MRELSCRLIRERQPCVVLTGAGMSTESGLPDFRSAAGIWPEVDPYEVATIDAFRRDPERVWGWYGPRIRSFLDVEPNPGHLALAALERAGHVEAVVTQNIDMLHSRAGSSERRRGARLDPSGGMSHLRRAGAPRRRARAARARAPCRAATRAARP